MEITKALELDYIVLEISSVWHYSEWMKYQPDTHDPTTGLFTGFMNQFVKMKTESSGWPVDVTTELEKTDYIRQYKEKEGIDLDPNNMIKNPAMRTLSKLMCNSFWGKYGQRNNMMQTIYFTNCGEFLTFLHDPKHEVYAVIPVSDTMIMCNYKKSEGFEDICNTTNVVIASITTAWARLKLYEIMEQLQERVQYCDTDSVIYTINPDDVYQPPCGNFLGQLTNELPPGCHITELIAAGPKNYAFLVFNPSTGQTTPQLKIRGFTLTHEMGLKLHIDEMRRMVRSLIEKGKRDKLELHFPKIVRLKDHTVVTKIVKKTYSVVFDKRRIMAHGNTLPWGYCAQ